MYIKKYIKNVLFVKHIDKISRLISDKQFQSILWHQKGRKNSLEQNERGN